MAEKALKQTVARVLSDSLMKIGESEFRRSETDFMDELEAAARLRPSFASNVFLFSILALVFFFILWASLSKIEEITHGSGQVVPSQEIQVVQSLEGGILGELLV